jgi:nucleoid DNA-binding protein
MNKAELIDVIATRLSSTKVDAERHLEGLLSVITETLTHGEELKLVGFGTFGVSQRKARTGRNPQTGIAIEIPASTVPAFKAGAQLKNAVRQRK